MGKVGKWEKQAKKGVCRGKATPANMVKKKIEEQNPKREKKRKGH